MRTATADFPLRDVTVRAGDAVALIYPSGNRDEALFDEPDRFWIDRDTSGHVAFGYGTHARIGRPPALLELEAFFGRPMPRLASLEPAGTPVPIASNFVDGYRRLPVRHALR